jgi:uncharacterized protein YfaS (alpha-2-macroglobulin family)
MFILLNPAFSAEITQFVPQGNIKEIRQVVVKFNSEMIPMGDPKINLDIFDIKCFGADKNKKIKLPTNTTRWADNKTWIMDFDEALSSGINCEYSIKDNVLDLSKTKVKQTGAYFFNTGGPRIVGSYPYSGAGISNDQYFIIQTDGDIDLKSFSSNVFLEISGINEKIKTKIIQDQNRNELIQFAIEHNYQWHNLRKELEKVKNNKKLFDEFKLLKFKNFIIFSADRKFPDGSKVVIHFSKGIKTLSGMATTEENIFEYETIAPFTAEFSCSRLSITEGCNPIENVSINFSNSLNAMDLKDTKLIGPGGKEWKANEFLEVNKKGLNAESELSQLTFKGPFPEKSQFKLILPNNLKDILDRKLTNQKSFPLTFNVTAYSPLIKFNGRFGILEKNGGANLPVSVRNIEKKILFDQSEILGKALNLSSTDQIKKVIDLYQRIQTKDEYPMVENDQRNIPVLAKNEGKPFYIPKPLGENEYEMMGIPLLNAGFYAIEIKSPRLGAALTTTKKEMYVQTSALVTNMAVHFKNGVESSLVWVTHLEDATPVDEALISVRNCNGEELASGKTSKDGTLKLKGLVYFKKPKDCERYNRSLYVFAKKDDDFSFVNTGWDKGIETYRYSVPVKSSYRENSYEDGIFHTLLDRVLFKPGETVSMKHFFREHHEFGFQNLNKKNWPVKILIKHSSSEKVYTLPLVIDPKTATANSVFKLPKEALTGRYNIYMSNKPAKKNKKKKAIEYEDSDEDSENVYDYEAKLTASFTISDYRLPVMEATLKIQGDELIRPSKINADISAQYLSGGPASKLNVKVRKQISNTFSTPEFIGSDEYSYYAKKIKEGILEDVKDEEEGKTDDQSIDLNSKSFALDKNGGEKVSFDVEKMDFEPKKISLEMEYTDPNGEIKSVNNYKTIFPSNVVVGVKVDSWLSNPELTKLEGVIVDLQNKRLPNHAYAVYGYKKVYYTHRKRLVGGFYSYDSKKEIQSVGKVCEGTTKEDGSFECLAKNLPPGYIILEATASDENKNPVYAAAEVEVFEKGTDVWWTPGDSDRIDLLPEKKMVEANEVAKIMVKTPFKEATALVTVEREGVLDSFVTKVYRDKPVIELPIKKNYAPNIYVSVTLIRGRIAEAKSDFLVDLNRPALKMGLIPLKVGWKSHLLNVNVSTNKKKYNTREKVEVTIKLKKADGSPLPKGSLVTLVAFDESLNLLKKNETFDILNSMMAERPLAVFTSSGQNQIIGKRHFGSKAHAPGGGGGHGDNANRELFNPLLAFIPDIKVSDDGIAKAVVTLNDSMTSFRIVAVATSSADLFGYGKTNIVSSKDLIIYSGAAPFIRNNDEINNKFTIRNTTEKEMNIDFNFSIPELSNDKNYLYAETLKLLPSEAKVIKIPLTVPKNIKNVSYKLEAKDKDSNASDSALIKVKIDKDLLDSVLQATMFQLEETNSISIQEPKEAITGSGGINISLNKSLVKGLSSVKSYMEEYPYSCLEQQVSKAIVLDDKKELKNIVNKLPSYMDQDGLLKFFSINNLCGSSMLSVYILSILNENAIVIPAESKRLILTGLKNSLSGNLTCHNWWDNYVIRKYLDEEKIKIFSVLARENQFNSTDLQSVKIIPNEWSTEALLSFKQLLIYGTQIADRDNLLNQTDNILRSRMNFQGTVMNLQSSLSDISRWSLFSSKDQEANLFLLDAVKDPNFKEDVGRIARGTVTRLRKGIWDTTMSMAWGITALKKFSEKYENVPLTGKTDITLAETLKSVEWTTQKNHENVLINWPKDNSSESKVNFKMQGTGKPWITLQTKSAIPLKAPLDLGYIITKKIIPVEVKKEGSYSVGDVLNIEVFIKAKSDQSWVAITDPIPSGASHLGNGLDGNSAMLDRSLKPTASGNADFPEDFSEKKATKFVSYAGYLPKGDYKIDYRIRLNSSGKFKLPNTRVEAMYAEEAFGEIPNNDIEVLE